MSEDENQQSAKAGRIETKEVIQGITQVKGMIKIDTKEKKNGSPEMEPNQIAKATEGGVRKAHQKKMEIKKTIP